MARVPNGAFPKVGATPDAAPYSRVNPTAAAFGALQGQAQQNLGKEISSFGETGMKIIIDINKENLQRNAKYAYNEYSNVVRTEMYGDGTEKNPGLLNLQGQAAIDARAGAMQRMADARVKITDSLTNDTEKDMFSNAANEHDDITMKNALSHVAKERITANDTAANLIMDTAVQDGTLGAADPETVHQNEIKVQQQAIYLATSKGLSEEAVRDAAKQAVSKYYESVITGRMQTNAAAGRSMLEQFTDRIGGKEVSILTQRLEAKERDEVNRAWEAEQHAHTKRIQYQNEQFSGLVNQIQFKGGGLLDVQKALDAGKIDGSQAENLVSFYNNKAKGGPGNPARANELKYLIMINKASYTEVMLDKTINETERSELLGYANTAAQNGGVLANQNVQDGQKVIDLLVANKTSPLAVIDNFDVAARLAQATTAYKQAVLTLPPDQITPTTTDTLARQVATAYLPASLSDPRQMIDSVLPKTKYWPWNGASSRATLEVNLQQAAYTLIKDRHKLSPSEYAEQGKILKMYRDAINRISDKPVVVNPPTK